MVNHMKKNGWGAFLRRKQYVIAGALVVVAAVATTVVYNNQEEKERQQVESELAEEMNESNQEAEELAQEEEPQEAAEASSLIPPESEETEMAELEAQSLEAGDVELNTEVKAEAESVETTVKSEQLHFSPEDGMSWPLEGNVILNYSMDATTYFPTLDQYKYNPAVVIEGEVNSKVYSVAKGKVTEIKNDEVTGCTMTVDLGSGYQAVYGQLKELNFEEGDYVEAGHVLGYVSEPTKYFAVEGSNLYFELQKDGQPVNPVEFFE